MQRGSISVVCKDLNLDQWDYLIGIVFPAIFDFLDDKNIDIDNIEGEVGDRHFVALGSTFYEKGVGLCK